MRGINAVIAVLVFALAIAALSGSGYFVAVGAPTYDDPATGDTNRILDALGDQSGTDQGGNSPIEGFTTGALNTLQVFWIIVTDTSELVMLFMPVQAWANAVETMVHVAFGLAFLALARGVVF